MSCRVAAMKAGGKSESAEVSAEGKEKEKENERRPKEVEFNMFWSRYRIATMATAIDACNEGNGLFTTALTAACLAADVSAVKCFLQRGAKLV